MLLRSSRCGIAELAMLLHTVAVLVPRALSVLVRCAGLAVIRLTFYKCPSAFCDGPSVPRLRDGRVVSEAMERARAEELLARERARVEGELGSLAREGPLEGDEHVEPGDEGSEDLYEDEVDEGRRETLEDELAAIERAEARLRAGTFGLSVESGTPIGDGRLEALPTAELTVEEEERRRGG
jgi:DnaK suppressor protein